MASQASGATQQLQDGLHAAANLGLGSRPAGAACERYSVCILLLKSQPAKVLEHLFESNTECQLLSMDEFSEDEALVVKQVKVAVSVVTKKNRLTILHTIDPEAPIEEGINQVEEAVAAQTGLLAADIKRFQYTSSAASSLDPADKTSFGLRFALSTACRSFSCTKAVSAWNGAVCKAAGSDLANVSLELVLPLGHSLGSGLVKLEKADTESKAKRKQQGSCAKDSSVRSSNTTQESTAVQSTPGSSTAEQQAPESVLETLVHELLASMGPLKDGVDKAAAVLIDRPTTADAGDQVNTMSLSCRMLF